MKSKSPLRGGLCSRSPSIDSRLMSTEPAPPLEPAVAVLTSPQRLVISNRARPPTAPVASSAGCAGSSVFSVPKAWMRWPTEMSPIAKALAWPAFVTPVAPSTVTVTWRRSKPQCPSRRSRVTPRIVSSLPLRATTTPPTPSWCEFSTLEPASTRAAVKVWSAVVSVPKAAVSVPAASVASCARPASPV